MLIEFAVKDERLNCTHFPNYLIFMFFSYKCNILVELWTSNLAVLIRHKL